MKGCFGCSIIDKVFCCLFERRDGEEYHETKEIREKLGAREDTDRIDQELAIKKISLVCHIINSREGKTVIKDADVISCDRIREKKQDFYADGIKTLEKIQGTMIYVFKILHQTSLQAELQTKYSFSDKMIEILLQNDRKHTGFQNHISETNNFSELNNMALETLSDIALLFSDNDHKANNRVYLPRLWYVTEITPEKPSGFSRVITSGANTVTHYLESIWGGDN